MKKKTKEFFKLFFYYLLFLYLSVINTKNYFGRKGCAMSDCDKILFYNKIHNC